MNERLHDSPVSLSRQRVALLDSGTSPVEENLKVANIQRKFWNMLVRYVPRSGYRPPVDRPTQILEIACGIGEVSQVMSTYFAGKDFDVKPEGNTHYIGIDINAAAINKAKETYGSLNHVFICDDATKLAEIPPQVDVVVVRHQHYKENPAVWTKLLRQGVERLSPEGILICTSYERDENNDMTLLLPQLHAYIAVNRENEESLPESQWRDFASDRYVIIAKRKPRQRVESI